MSKEHQEDSQPNTRKISQESLGSEIRKPSTDTTSSYGDIKEFIKEHESSLSESSLSNPEKWDDHTIKSLLNAQNYQLIVQHIESSIEQQNNINLLINSIRQYEIQQQLKIIDTFLYPSLYSINISKSTKESFFNTMLNSYLIDLNQNLSKETLSNFITLYINCPKIGLATNF